MRRHRMVVLLHPDGAFRIRLMRAVSDRWDVVEVSSWAELEEVVARAGVLVVAVVDPYHGTDREGGPAPELRRLMERFPSVRVVVGVVREGVWVEDLCRMGGWGVAGALDLEIDQHFLLMRKRLEEVLARRLYVTVLEGLGSGSSVRAKVILSAAMEVALQGGGAGMLARRLSLGREMLVSWCRLAGLPIPRRLIGWMRLLAAAELLDDPARSVASAALGAGYSSDRMLRRMAGRMGLPAPTELRSCGALEQVVMAFSREIGGEVQISVGLVP